MKNWSNTNVIPPNVLEITSKKFDLVGIFFIRDDARIISRLLLPRRENSLLIVLQQRNVTKMEVKEHWKGAVVCISR